MTDTPTSKLGWWTISGEMFLEALYRVQDGDEPEMIYAEWYANSEVEKFDDENT